MIIYILYRLDKHYCKRRSGDANDVVCQKGLSGALFPKPFLQGGAVIFLITAPFFCISRQIIKLAGNRQIVRGH